MVFPILGFIVERFLAFATFIREPSWKLRVFDIPGDVSVEFM